MENRIQGRRVECQIFMKASTPHNGLPDVAVWSGGNLLPALPIRFRWIVWILGATSGTCCSIQAKADSTARLHCRTIISSVYKVNITSCSFERMFTAHLSHACWVRLHQRAETSVSRILLFVVSNFVKGLAPGLCKLWQMGGDDPGMHESYTSNRNCCIFV